MVSCGARVACSISMTEPSTLVEKAIGRLNATWNSIKNRKRAVPKPLQLLELALRN